MKKSNLLHGIAALVLLFCVSISTAYAKVDPRYIDVTVQNGTGFATSHPARALNYTIEPMGKYGQSGNFDGKVAPNSIEQASLWPLDSTVNSVVFNVVITDPAANNRVIFKAQYYYDLLPDANHRISQMIMQSDSHYYVIPNQSSPTEQLPAMVSIAIQDQ